jgi:hypothetical protein
MAQQGAVRGHQQQQQDPQRLLLLLLLLLLGAVLLLAASAAVLLVQCPVALVSLLVTLQVTQVTPPSHGLPCSSPLAAAAPAAAALGLRLPTRQGLLSTTPAAPAAAGWIRVCKPAHLVCCVLRLRPPHSRQHRAGRPGRSLQSTCTPTRRHLRHHAPPRAAAVGAWGVWFPPQLVALHMNQQQQQQGGAVGGLQQQQHQQYSRR